MRLGLDLALMFELLQGWRNTVWGGVDISVCGWLNAIQFQADQLGEKGRIC